MSHLVRYCLIIRIYQAGYWPVAFLSHLVRYQTYIGSCFSSIQGWLVARLELAHFDRVR